MDKMSIYVSKASSSACFLDAIVLAILFLQPLIKGIFSLFL